LSYAVGVLQLSVSRREKTAPANVAAEHPPKSRSKMHWRSVRSRGLAPSARANAMALHAPTVALSMAAQSDSHSAAVTPTIGAVPNATVCRMLSTRLWLGASSVRCQSRRPAAECTVARMFLSALPSCGLLSASASRKLSCDASCVSDSRAYSSVLPTLAAAVAPLLPPRRTCRCSSAVLSAASPARLTGGGGGGLGEMLPKHLLARTRSLAIART